MNEDSVPKKKRSGKPGRRIAGRQSGRETSARPSFEESLEALEKVVQQLEQGDLGLNDALTTYEQGVRFLKQCYHELEAAERRVELLTGTDEDEEDVVEPFDEEAMSLEEKAAARGARRGAKRTRPPEPAPDVDDAPGLF